MFKKIYSRISSFIRSLFAFEKKANDVVRLNVHAVEHEPEPERKSRRKKDNTKSTIKHELFDNLGVYFKYINHMKKHDKESYELYKKIGAQIIRHQNIYFWDDEFFDDLPARWKQIRPSFGCVLWSDTDGEETTCPRFVYFNKYENTPKNCQPVSEGCDVYLVSVLWADKKIKDGKEISAVTQYAVSLDKESNIHVLKTRYVEQIKIRTKHGPARGETFNINRPAWGIPEFYKSWAKEKNTDPITHMKKMFFGCAHAYDAAQYGMIEVRAYKNNTMARFNIDTEYASYLFKDRENLSNYRKPIFHLVRTHERETKNGKSFVKTHFRGERQFTWNGYAIKIVVPNKDTAVFLPETNLALHEYDENEKEDGMTLIEFSDVIAAANNDKTMHRAINIMDKIMASHQENKSMN